MSGHCVLQKLRQDDVYLIYNCIGVSHPIISCGRGGLTASRIVAALVTRLSMMLLSLTLASSVCVHRPSPLRFASRSRPALCLSPPATEAAVVNPALRSKVQPEIVELVSATESCQLMDPQQIDALVIVMHRYCTWIVGPWIPPPTHPGVQGGKARDRYAGQPG